VVAGSSARALPAVLRRAYKKRLFLFSFAKCDTGSTRDYVTSIAFAPTPHR